MMIDVSRSSEKRPTYIDDFFITHNLILVVNFVWLLETYINRNL